MGHEGINFKFLAVAFLIILSNTIIAQEEPFSVYSVRVNDPVQFGKSETHKLEFFKNGTALYKRFSGSTQNHCDSVIPARYKEQGKSLLLSFPDREDWLLTGGINGEYQILQREDGFVFLKPIPPSLKPSPNKKSRKSKIRRQRCPEF